MSDNKRKKTMTEPTDSENLQRHDAGASAEIGTIDQDYIDIALLRRDEDSYQLELENEIDINSEFDKLISDLCKPTVEKKNKNNVKNQTSPQIDEQIISRLQEDAMLACPSGSKTFSFDLTPKNQDEEYTFESLFGVVASDPFEKEVDYAVIPRPDHTKKSIVTRQVQAYYEGQKKMKVPSLPVDPQCYETKSADRLVYEEKNNSYWESVLTQLGLDNEDHIKFIMKPDFCDVLPVMLNKYKHGLMPTIDSTWTIAPRLNPCTVFERLKSSNFASLLPDYYFDRQNGVLIFTHNDFPAPLRYKTNNDADLEHNAFRRILVLVNRKLDGSLDNIIRNLKHYGTSMVQSRNVPRYLGENDRFLEYNDQLTKYCAELRQADMREEGDKLYKLILRAKQFRYSYEERNKENLYYSANPRSSYFRYEFFLPDDNVKRIAIFAPDKRLTHSSLMSLLIKGNYEIHLYSDIALNEHGNSPHMYQRTINIYGTSNFFRANLTKLNEYDIIYVDFVEVKVMGRMLFGSYCQANILVRDLQQKGYSGTIISRLGVSPEFPILTGYCLSAVSIFKAGGLEYIARITKFSADEWNKAIYAKLYAIKHYIEYARRITLMAGFGLMCHDFLRPVQNEIRWTVPETAFSLAGGTFKPFAYQHTRQTNKFTIRSEDFLDNWVSLSKQAQNPEDRLYSSALLHSNFDIDAAVGLLDSMQVPNSEARLRSVMNQMVKMNELPKDLLSAIRVSITLPKKKSYLLKRCKRLEDYMGLFEILDETSDPMMRFIGACEMTDQMRTIYDINNMRLDRGNGKVFFSS